MASTAIFLIQSKPTVFDPNQPFITEYWSECLNFCGGLLITFVCSRVFHGESFELVVLLLDKPYVLP